MCFCVAFRQLSITLTFLTVDDNAAFFTQASLFLGLSNSIISVDIRAKLTRHRHTGVLAFVPAVNSSVISSLVPTLFSHASCLSLTTVSKDDTRHTLLEI